MTKINAILLLGALLSGCGHEDGDVQVLLVKPITPLQADGLAVTVTNYVQTDPKDLSIPDVEFKAAPADRWQEAYGMFSMSLINEAKKSQLNRSLYPIALWRC